METTELQAKKSKKGLFIALAVFVLIAIAAVAFTLSYNSPSKKIDRKLALAERYMTELEYEEAIALYNEVLEIEPKSVAAYKGLFEAYIATGDEAKAREILDKARDILPADEQARMRSAFEEKYGGAKDSKDAEAAEEERASTSGKCTKALYFEGDGTLTGYTEYIYDASGQLVKSVYYDDADTVREESEFGADGSEENWWITYYDDGTIFKRVTLYDANRRELKRTDYENGEITYKTENEYDADGKRIKDTVFSTYTLVDENGGSSKVTSTYWLEYQYGNNGRKATVISHSNDGKTMAHDEEYDENWRLLIYYFDDSEHRYWYEHGYDSEGNEIKNIYFHEGVASSGSEYILNERGEYAEYITYSNGTHSRITYKYEYDSMGNKTKILSYDSDGSLVAWTEYVYD